MNNNRQIALVVILIIASFVIGIYLGYRYNSYGNQSGSVSVTAQSSTTVPTSETAPTVQSTEPETETTVSEETEPVDTFNYLAIGNSITRHAVTEFWWNNIGMAASDIDHDYYHIVYKYLEEHHDIVNGQILNLSVWEYTAEDRTGTLAHYLQPFLNPDLDLITIMLGENVDDLETYQEDYVALLKYIRSKAPNARILVVEDFWTDEERNEMEFNACALTDAEYVSLDGISGNDEYYCGLGTTVYDEYGNEYTVEHEGVAMHPGDAGMAAIAERIIAALEK